MITSLNDRNKFEYALRENNESKIPLNNTGQAPPLGKGKALLQQ